MTTKSAHKRHLPVGPGGMKCACCFPAPGSDYRKQLFRRNRKIEKREAAKEIAKELAALPDKVSHN